ncbi:MAG: radical SAM protein [Verrucomicrobiaceae bacterium]|nr:radical SAM protein [Verrucomicrobiaceae bacterium]
MVKTRPEQDVSRSQQAELFVIPLGDERQILYAPLQRVAVIADVGLVEAVKQARAGRGEGIRPQDGDLINAFRELRLVGYADEVMPITEFQGTPMPTALTLFLTTACNLRCTYCYASAGDTPVKGMPFEVAKRGIDFICANAKKTGSPKIGLAFHGGGEPTVNWRTLTSAHAYASERAHALGLELESALATNGVLSEAQLTWAISNLTGASVSFDGLPATHDRHRPLATGGGSSERVMETLRRMDEAGFPYAVRVTVTADQIHRLVDSIGFITERFKPESLQVEPVYQLGRGLGTESAETKAFIEAFRAAKARARQNGADLLFSGARLDALTNHFCGISQDGFALTPDGNVSACYETFSESQPLSPTFHYGKPATAGSGYDFDMQRLEHLRHQAVQHRPYCSGCFAKWHCAGDCFHKAISQSGGTEFKGSARCDVIRELTKDQILDEITAAGGVYWQADRHGYAHAPKPIDSLL